ncbi:MAG: DNA repair protein RadA [Cyclobacteriaceae bacterium]
MAKTKTVFICQSCGANSPKWQGKCSSCGEWNTYTEELAPDTKKVWKGSTPPVTTPNKPVPVHEVKIKSQQRVSLNDGELDRVLGGGLVPGSLVLIGGEPGIGKSTLMLQVALNLPQLKVLYVSGEESESQIKLRAERIGIKTETCFILSEISLEAVFHQIEALQPDILVIDSIQTLRTESIESIAGSISQVRECANALMQFAKSSGTPVFLIGHITKEGSLAGPKVLEHMVDTVLQFEGDRHLVYRILRTHKNRFGSTSELGIYEMRGTGLRQVTNPSEILISQREEDLSGVAISSTLEGNRPLLIEVQALVSPATYGTPQRSSTGFDIKRLNMLLAVLEKRGGMKLNTQDVFINLAGGLRIDDPAIDLAICAAIISSYQEIPIPDKTCFAGEVGLGGEIRAINRLENRIAEAEKLGFNKIIVSGYNVKGLDLKKFNIEVFATNKLGGVFTEIFG